MLRLKTLGNSLGCLSGIHCSHLCFEILRGKLLNDILSDYKMNKKKPSEVHVM